MVAMGSINIVGIIAAAAVGMGLGMLWHGPLFGKLWIKLQKISPKELAAAQKKGMKGMMNSVLVQFISLLITAGCIEFIASMQAYSSAVIWEVGFIWLGFVAQAQLTAVLWQKKPAKLYAFDTIYSLVLLLVLAFVLNAMG
ncbi:MAG: DUF1761 domain-containing protein [Candidatus Micrarchaeota archaeon]|nr:DUF1761 domain-containing protein [Candidatus Micrarchaeota archaeon]